MISTPGYTAFKVLTFDSKKNEHLIHALSPTGIAKEEKSVHAYLGFREQGGRPMRRVTKGTVGAVGRGAREPAETGEMAGEGW